MISAALNDPLTRYEVVLACTGSNKLAEPSARDLLDLAEEFNDVSDVDKEQNRIRMELAIDGIDYQVLRTDSVVRSENAFDLVEVQKTPEPFFGAHHQMTRLFFQLPACFKYRYW